MKYVFFFGFIFLTYLGGSQSFDTLRVMSYNLLYYGQYTSFCTNSNNNINEKDEHFKTITDYIQPDILIVNELGANEVYAERILDRVLNEDGQDIFDFAPIQNSGFSSLVNGVFYNREKLVLIKQEMVSENLNGTDIVRVIDVCSIYYRDENLTPESDTAFLHVIAMHLKAGDASSDKEDRDLATEALMDFLTSSHSADNFILAGDLNLKNSKEAAYANLVNHPDIGYRFFDPLTPDNIWSNSSAFAATHTQSTRTEGGCASGGGLDSLRFNSLLVSI